MILAADFDQLKHVVAELVPAIAVSRHGPRIINVAGTSPICAKIRQARVSAA
jgi:hypothetical protein